MKMHILAALLLASGCHALDGLRGWNAAAQTVLSDEILGKARAVKMVAEAERPEPVEGAPAEPCSMDVIVSLMDDIERAATDNKDRAFLSQLDHNHLPKEPPVIGSDDDNLNKMAYAGKGYNRAAWRTWRAEFLPKLGRAIGMLAGSIVKSVVPGWLITLISLVTGALVISCGVLAFLWVRGKMFKKAAIQMTILANKHVPKEVLAATDGTPAQQVYRKARDKGLLEE